MSKRSLILVTVDCLRADHVGYCGYSRPVTPFLDSLAKTSLVFSEAIVAGAPTYFSFPAILASRYPLGLGREILGIAPGEPTLASVLRECGYQTAAFVAGNPYLTERFGYDQGFEQYQDFLQSESHAAPSNAPQNGSRPWSNVNRQMERLSRKTKVTASAYDELYFRYCQWRSRRGISSMDQLRRYPSADVLVGEAISWIQSLQDRPFFLWIHLMDPHHPYYPPQEALSSLGFSNISTQRALFLNSFWNRGDIGASRLERHREEIITLYDAGVRWVDQQMSRLVEALQKQQRWNDTVLAVTADHGEEFLEHGIRYHSPVGLPEQLIRVPLLVRTPSVASERIVRGPFSLIHLAPMLLEALAVEVPASFQGERCWSRFAQGGESKGNPAIVECVEACNNPWSVADRLRPRLLAVRDRDYKLVIRFNDQVGELYALKADPLEQHPLPNDVGKEERARLWRFADQYLRDVRKRRDPALALRARLREIRRQLSLERTQTTPGAQPKPFEIEGHG